MLQGVTRKPLNRADTDEELVDLVAKVLQSPQALSTARSLIAWASEALAAATSEAREGSAFTRRFLAVNHAIHRGKKRSGRRRGASNRRVAVQPRHAIEVVAVAGKIRQTKMLHDGDDHRVAAE